MKKRFVVSILAIVVIGLAGWIDAVDHINAASFANWVYIESSGTHSDTWTSIVPRVMKCQVANDNTSLMAIEYGSDPMGHWTVDTGYGALCQVCYDHPIGLTATVESLLQIQGYIVSDSNMPGTPQVVAEITDGSTEVFNNAAYTAIEGAWINEAIFPNYTEAGDYPWKTPTHTLRALGYINDRATDDWDNVVIRADLNLECEPNCTNNTVALLKFAKKNGSAPGAADVFGDAWEWQVSNEGTSFVMQETVASLKNDDRIALFVTGDNAGNDTLQVNFGRITVIGAQGGTQALTLSVAVAAAPTNLAEGCTIALNDNDPAADSIVATVCTTPFSSVTATDSVAVKGSGVTCSTDANCNLNVYQVASVTAGATLTLVAGEEIATNENGITDIEIYESMHGTDIPKGTGGEGVVDTLTSKYIASTPNPWVGLDSMMHAHTFQVDDGECLQAMLKSIAGDPDPKMFRLSSIKWTLKELNF